MGAMSHSALSRVPASFFGIVLGVVGLGNTWRAAAKLWPLPPLVGEVLLGLGALIWLALTPGGSHIHSRRRLHPRLRGLAHRPALAGRSRP
jgi:hypothetical protein